MLSWRVEWGDSVSGRPRGGRLTIVTMNKKLHPVAVLIDSVKAVEECSDQDLVNRARARGHPTSKQNLSRIRTQPVVTVSAEQVAMLSDALRVPRERVVAAYLEAMGLPYREGGSVGTEDAIRADPRLSSDDKDVLLDLLRSMVKRRKKVSDTEAVPNAVNGVGDPSGGGVHVSRSAKSTQGHRHDEK
jgi:hypothetical protein